MTHLQEFFDHVVNNEQSENAFARHHKVVTCRHVADQFDCAEVP